MSSTENLPIVIFSENAQKLPLCPVSRQSPQYKLDLAGGGVGGWEMVLQAGLRRALGMRTSCSGPDSTCCVDSNYPRT